MRDPVYRFRGHQRPDETSRTPILAATNDLPTTVVDGNVAKMRLYDPIDNWGEFWGISSSEFALALDLLPATVAEIHLHINSPGGVIYEGIAILSQLRQWSAIAPQRRVVAIVDGLAASIASLIAVGADETVMNPDTLLMIHDGSGFCGGTAADMHAAGDALDLMSNTIAGVYARKTGGTAADWRAVMVAKGVMGQWYSADEALAAGLIDRIAEAPTLEEPTVQAAARAATHRAALSAVSAAAQPTVPPPLDRAPDDSNDVPAADTDTDAAEATAAATARADADRHRHSALLTAS